MTPDIGVIRFVDKEPNKDKDKRATKRPAMPSDAPSEHSTDIDEFFRGLGTEMRHPKPGPEAIAAAMEAAQRLAAEADLEESAGDSAQEIVGDLSAPVCPTCGHRNRSGNRFCAMCGTACDSAQQTVMQTDPPDAGRVSSPSQALTRPPNGFPGEPEARHLANRSGALETHHYHHHYHHHYFPGGYDGNGPRPADYGRAEHPRDSGRDSTRDLQRDDKLRPNPGMRGDMSRAEATVRHMTQEWVLACNTKHLDDLLDLYTADAMVLRSNYPPVRGAAAVREFFFGVLTAGLGEVEVDPLRLEVVGDLAYEAGRCKALVPSAAGKRREERGKYLWVFARQSGSEWKLAADIWSSDLTLATLESDIPASPGVRTTHPRKP
jgi:ketosteroid isomerase-like protein